MTSVARLGAGPLIDAMSVVLAALQHDAEALDHLERSGDAVADPFEAGTASDAGSAGRGAVGSDMALTLERVCAGIERSASLNEVATAFAGAPRHAVGTGGGALALLLAGLGEALRNADDLDARGLAIGLEIAADLFDEERADRPPEGPGTASPVVRAAAEAALATLDEGGPLADVVLSATDGGLAELERGPSENPALAERGVVDAVAAGLLVVLDALCGVVTGEGSSAGASGSTLLPPLPSDGTVFEVSCRIAAHEGSGIEDADRLVALWYEMGEVIRFDPVGGSWPATLRTSLPGAAIEAIYDVGRPRELHIGVAVPASGGAPGDGPGDEVDGIR